VISDALTEAIGGLGHNLASVDEKAPSKPS
ncbi:uncharacterized protein METZ01_LOCUS216202, partial [marine metagenome]